MKQLSHKIVFECLRLVLRPAVALCLKHSFKLQDIVECLKLVFIDLAAEKLERSGEKVTDSRLHIMTGVHRPDIVRFRKEPPAFDQSKGLISKILGQWQNNKRFLLKSGKPAILSIGADSEFNNLVRSVNTDLNPATVLFELQRVGAVENVRGGVRLMVHNYVPKSDAISGFKVYADDFMDLCRVVDKNVLEEIELPHHHLRTEFDSIRSESAEEIKSWFLKEGHAFHLKANQYLAQFDQDTNPLPHYNGQTTRAVFSSFALIEEEQE